MPPKNNVNYGGECYFMMTRDDGTIYEVTGSIEEVSVDELAVSAWADDNNYRRPVRGIPDWMPLLLLHRLQGNP